LDLDAAQAFACSLTALESIVASRNALLVGLMGEIEKELLLP
jgi:hypothetical protein